MVDLAEHAGDLFDWGAPGLVQLTAEVASAGLIVAASPTYKATYTGMLKAFFDRYGSSGLAGSVAVPLMTGGAPIHALAVEVHLRPLLVELGCHRARPWPVRHRARVRRPRSGDRALGRGRRPAPAPRPGLAAHFIRSCAA